MVRGLSGSDVGTVALSPVLGAVAEFAATNAKAPGAGAHVASVSGAEAVLAAVESSSQPAGAGPMDSCRGAVALAADRHSLAPGPGTGSSDAAVAVLGQAVLFSAEGDGFDNSQDNFSDTSSGCINTVQPLGMGGRHRGDTLVDFRDLIAELPDTAS